jgi:4-aminobutyrate aminotransferase-like enzyme/Ser/Thr protein kinase RdoA (MazF antagonist)
MSEEIVGGDVSVLEATPPRFSAAEVAGFAEKLFGVSGEAVDLGSERDQTFLIDDGGAGGVVKISNLGESPAVLDLETQALLHIGAADPELPVARPRLALGAGPGRAPAAYRPIAEGPDGRHYVRMFERLRGRKTVTGEGLDDAAVQAYGCTLARLALALRGYFHPAAGRVLLWDTKHALELRDHLPCIPDDSRRALVERVLHRYQERLSPAWPHLRAQVVHGDLALDNVLLDDRGRVTGIVDFGDIVHTALMADVAAAMASVLRGRPGDDVFRSARLFLDGYASLTPLEPLEIELLCDLLAARLATIVTISAWRVRRYPENAAYIEAWDAGSWALLEQLADVGFDRAAVELGSPAETASSVTLAERRNRVLGPALTGLSYSRPVHVARGEGPWLLDADGQRLLDAYNNVPVVGHCHPRVTEAVVRQTRRLNTHARYLYEPLVELAERLVATMPAGSGLDTVTLVNSGSEATDLAWRIASACTGNAGGIVTGFAYHGVTAAAADLSPEEWPAGAKPERVETIAMSGGRAGDEVDGAIARLAGRGVAPAALYLDCGFTSDGILTPPAGDVAKVVARAREAGAVFVADEVQAGYGRSGEHLWSFASYGVVPDMVTLGKPMGNGYPVAAVIVRRDLAERFAESGQLFSTFGGNPVACAAALTVLDVIEDERLISHTASVGAALRRAIEELLPRHPALGGVRGRGLLIGADIVSDAGEPDPGRAATVVDVMRERRVLVGRTGPHANVLKIRPPLVFAEHHVGMLVAALDAGLSAVSGGAARSAAAFDAAVGAPLGDPA